MGIKSAMSTFLHCMFAPVSQMPLSSTWQHLSLISAVQIKRQRGKKQAAGLFKSSRWEWVYDYARSANR